MLIVQCVLDSGTGLNIDTKSLIPFAYGHLLYRGKMPKLQTASNNPLHIDHKILVLECFKPQYI